MAVVCHVSKHDEMLQSYLNNPVTNSRIKYTSPDIQNDIMGIYGEMLPEIIVRACDDFEYFGLIDDEATVVSTHEQVSVCVMFVECTSGKVTLREEMSWFCVSKRNYR